MSIVREARLPRLLLAALAASLFAVAPHSSAARSPSGLAVSGGCCVVQLASALEGQLAGVPTLHGGRVMLPLIVGGAVRNVRLPRGARLVHGRTRLDLGALRIGDRVRVPTHQRRVAVARRGAVISFRALSDRIKGAQGAGVDASNALHTFLTVHLDRPGAESLRTTLNTLDERVLSAADGLGAERQAIVAVVGSSRAASRDAGLLSRLQAAVDASHTASGQLEQAVTQLDTALSLIPPTGTNLPFDSVSAVPDLATSALNYLKQSLPPVGNLLQAILAGGG
jgi:hypothetical protein